jgi:hypothetical protein
MSASGRWYATTPIFCYENSIRIDAVFSCDRNTHTARVTPTSGYYVQATKPGRWGWVNATSATITRRMWDLSWDWNAYRFEHHFNHCRPQTCSSRAIHSAGKGVQWHKCRVALRLRETYISVQQPARTTRNAKRRTQEVLPTKLQKSRSSGFGSFVATLSVPVLRLSWLFPTNRDKNTCLATWLPPLPCYCAHHCQFSQALFD